MGRVQPWGRGILTALPLDSPGRKANCPEVTFRWTSQCRSDVQVQSSSSAVSVQFSNKNCTAKTYVISVIFVILVQLVQFFSTSIRFFDIFKTDHRSGMKQPV